MTAMTDSPSTQRLAASIVIPTFGRGQVLLDTIDHLLRLPERADEIIVVDQNAAHESAVHDALANWASAGAIRWVRLAKPSITHAMNRGLLEATGDFVLFVDDDIIPRGDLVGEHRRAHEDPSLPPQERAIIAGRVLQPWHVDGSRPFDRLASDEPGFVPEFIGCNFSVDRRVAIQIGGFDERFVRVAYRYEAEFGWRAMRRGFRIRFAPAACIHHLKADSGGTRSFGHHLRTLMPAHTVGQYYFLLRVRPSGWIGQVLLAPIRAVTTRFHLRHPWWMPPMLVAQVLGFCWAANLVFAGPRLIDVAASELQQ